MKGFSTFFVCTISAVICVAAPGDKPPSVPTVALTAMQKYQTAISAANAECLKTVEHARVQLVADLKMAQKRALERDDVDGATACAVLAKTYARDSVPPENYAGTVWTEKKYHIRLKSDGTIEHSDPQFGGTWAVIGERTVAIFFNHGYVEVWKMDKDRKTYKGTAYRQFESIEGAEVQ